MPGLDIIGQIYARENYAKNNHVAHYNLCYGYMDSLKIFLNTFCLPKNHSMSNYVIPDLTTKVTMPCLGEKISADLENN